MKKIKLILLVSITTIFTTESFAQRTELQQLALNVEKLAQFKQILADLKKGYEIVSGGYGTIKDLSKGNFDLHNIFLENLLAVNPALKNYSRCAEIVKYQIQILKEYKNAYKKAKAGGWFNPGEINYMAKVYNNLFKLSLKNLDDLFKIITASELRMSDIERLTIINTIHEDMQDKLLFLRSFNNKNILLALQRAKENRDVENLNRTLIVR